MGDNVKLELISNGQTLDISDVTNYKVLGQAGFGLSPLHRILIRGPQQHGDFDLGYLLDPRLLQLTVRLHATSVDTLFTLQNQLISFCNPTNSDLSLRFTRVASNVVSQIDCYCVGGLDFAVAKWEGFNIQEPLQLYANDPTWYDPTAQYLGFNCGGGANTYTIPMVVPHMAGTSTINASGVIPYTGTADSYFYGTITGPVTSPVITFSDGTNTYTLDFTGTTIAAGHYFTIDTRYPYKTVIDDTGANQNGALTTASNLATIVINKMKTGESAHNTTVTVAGTSANAATRIDINWYNRYIAAR